MSGRFAFYAEPSLIASDGGTISLHVGLGSDGPEESLWIHLGDGYRNDAEIHLGIEDVTKLVAVLTECLNAMDEEL